MDKQAGELRIEGNNYHVQDKRHFRAYKDREVSAEDKRACFDFAYDMSYGERGEHRDSRSGGQVHRTPGQIFINTFQGKMAEFALYRYLEEHNIEAERPDVAEYGLGIWDSFDLECQGKHISVKSTKSYGNLLLLETKDWNDNGEYIPNIESGTAEYDYMVLVRLEPDGERLMGDLLRQRRDEIPQNIREVLMERICAESWSYDFPGFIYHSELVRMIRERRIIPQNAMLNGRIRMDAENYYFQTGNMHFMKEIFLRGRNEEPDERASLRLKRKCPECGKTLSLKHGQYSWFWGCDGYFDASRCTYKDKKFD